ncbi:MAG: hypothetical protein ABFD62_01595 [Syntrophaceae bacterium]
MEKARKRRTVSNLLAALLIFSVFLLPVEQAFACDFENLTVKIGRGFGDNMNRYAWAMSVFKGRLYVGTWNAQLDYLALFQLIQSGELPSNPLEAIGVVKSEGAEIWRYDGKLKWTKVYKAAPADAGFRIMLVYKGYLYSGTLNSTTGASLFRSKDGSCWEKLGGGPLANADNTSIRTLLEYRGLLYVGTENNKTGGELWAFDGRNWELKQTFTDPSVAELCEFKGKLYMGTWNFNDTFHFFQSPDGCNFTDVTPVFAGSADLHNLGVMKLIVFQKQFYLGTVNYQDGFTLLRTKTPGNPNGWEVLTTNGFNDKDNSYTWSMLEFRGTLYLGTFNSGIYGGIYAPLFIPLDGRAQLWASDHGNDWVKLVNDGFDRFNYGFRNMVVYNNQLVIGTASDFLIPDPAHIDLDAVRAALSGLLGKDIDLTSMTQVMGELNSFIQKNPNWIGTEIWITEW